MEKESAAKLIERYTLSNRQLQAELEHEHDISYSLKTMIKTLEDADATAVEKLKSAWANQKDIIDRHL